MTNCCLKGVLVTEWWGERGCVCQGLQGLLCLILMLLQLELELQGWEEGGEISTSRQSNSNYSLTVCQHVLILCASAFMYSTV